MTAVPVTIERPRTQSLSVALIQPPTVVVPSGLSTAGPTPSIGLAYVAAALRAGGHRVCVVDGTGEGLGRHHDYDTSAGRLRRIGLSPEEIVSRIPEGVRLVGIANMFLHEWPHVQEIAERVRARFGDVTIAIGGENATAYWPLAHGSVDAIDLCVLGEGEQTIVEVADRLASGLPIDDVQGIALRTDSGVVSTGLPKRHRRLIDIARPAWDLFPVDAYLDQPDALGLDRGRSMPMLATRGCPYSCTFCSAPQMWTTSYVVRPPSDVVDEIVEHIEQRGIRNVDFVDLTAITRRKWTLEFCDELDRRGVDITWQLPIGTRSEALDREVLQRLWDTGCRNIGYAPESGSPRMLSIMQKKVDLEHLLASVREAHRIGFSIHANVIIGHPEERWRDLFASAWYLVRLAVAGCDSAAAIMFSAYPGSADFARWGAGPEADFGEAWMYAALTRGATNHVGYNPRFAGRRLRLAQLAMMATFYGLTMVRKPSRVFGMWKAYRRGEERTTLERLIRLKRFGFEGAGAGGDGAAGARRAHPQPAR